MKKEIFNMSNVNITHSIKKNKDTTTITFEIGKDTNNTNDFSGDIYEVIEQLKEMAKESKNDK